MFLHVDDFNECLFTCQKWIPFQNIFNLSLSIVRALFLVIRHRKLYLIAKKHNFRVTSAILQSMLTFLKSSLKGVYAWLSKPKILVQLMWNIVQGSLNHTYQSQRVKSSWKQGLKIKMMMIGFLGYFRNPSNQKGIS